MTPQDLVDAALRDIGVLASGESPSTDESNDVFAELNKLLESWSTEGVICYQKKHNTFATTAGTSAYTLGPSGDWATTNSQVAVEGAESVSGNFRQGMRVVNFSDFGKLALPDPTGPRVALPELMGVDAGWPLINCRLYKTPDGSGSIVVHSFEVLAAFGALDDSLDLPPGYARALQKNLALDVADQFGRTPTQSLLTLAQQSKSEIAGRTPASLAPPAAQ